MLGIIKLVSKNIIPLMSTVVVLYALVEDGVIRIQNK